MLYQKFKTVIITAVMLTLLPAIGPEGESNLKISGAFLGGFNYIHQENATETSPERQQFDFGANLVFQWEVSKRLRATVQFQGAVGEGSIGLASYEPVITDLNVEIDLSRSFTAAFGSFDALFGLESDTLSSNADVSRNPLILNSLFYSAFTGSNLGTVNIVGFMAQFENQWCRLGGALANGTNSTALNEDGNFLYLAFAQYKPFQKTIQIGASYINSKDRSLSGTSGTEVHLKGWMLDLSCHIRESFQAAAYYGEMTYGDGDHQTDDLVRTWKVEARYLFKEFHIVGRLSTWTPGNSLFIPHPGLAMDTGTAEVGPGEQIYRYQVGIGWAIKPNTLLKAEWVYDDYPYVNSQNFDTQGVILVFNVLF
jgi:hypothetical protein